MTSHDIDAACDPFRENHAAWNFANVKRLSPNHLALNVRGRASGTHPSVELDHVPSRNSAEHFWNWREAISPFWDIAVNSQAEAIRFQARAQFHHLGSGILCRTATSGHSRRRTPPRIAQVGVDHVILKLLVQGSLHLESCAEDSIAGPGDICFIDMGLPLAGSASQYEAVSLIMPRELLLSYMPEPSRLHGTILPGHLPSGHLLARHVQALTDSVEHLSPQEAAALVSGTAALAASCCAHTPSSLNAAPEPEEPAILLTLRRYIDRNPGGQEMTVDRIAERFGLSRSALYRLFKPLGGVAEYIRRRRLARAYRELIRPRHPGTALRVAVIARDCGFENDAVFSRAFRRAYGFSPREARAAATRPPRVASDEAPVEVLRRWVTDLARP